MISTCYNSTLRFRTRIHLNKNCRIQKTASGHSIIFFYILPYQFSHNTNQIIVIINTKTLLYNNIYNVAFFNFYYTFQRAAKTITNSLSISSVYIFVRTYFFTYVFSFYFPPRLQPRRSSQIKILYINCTRGADKVRWTTKKRKIWSSTITRHWTRLLRATRKTFDRSERVSRAHCSAAGALMSHGGCWQRRRRRRQTTCWGA